MKWLMLISSLAVAAECYSTLDIKSNTCNVLCRKDEYELGYYELKSNSCVCARKYKWNEFTRSIIKIIPGVGGSDY